jgi:hypothetical protein
MVNTYSLPSESLGSGPIESTLITLIGLTDAAVNGLVIIGGAITLIF